MEAVLASATALQINNRCAPLTTKMPNPDGSIPNEFSGSDLPRN